MSDRQPRTDLYKVSFTKLELHPNVREDIVKLDELILSIKENGVIQPLSGYKKDGKWYVIDGSRRYYAMKSMYEADNVDTECTFMIIPRSSTDEEIIVRQLTANSGEPLSPLEKSYAVKKLLDAGWNTKTIAGKLSISETYVKRLLSMVNAPEKFIALVKNKTISATFAMDMIAEGKAKVEDFLTTHQDGGFSHYEAQEIFAEPEFKSKKEKKQGDITKKDLMDGTKTINSWNEFKKYCDKADYLEMWEGKIYSPQEVFFFFLELKNNNMAWEGIKDFFMATIEVKEKKVKDDIKDAETKKPERKPLVDTDETVVREYPK